MSYNLKRQLVFWSGVFILCSWVMPFVIAVLGMFGIHFLPAPTYFNSFDVWFPWIAGAVMSIPLACCFVTVSWGDGFKSNFLTVAFVCATAGATGFGFDISLKVGAPMIHAAIFGRTITLDYETVPTLSTGSQSSFCRKSMNVNVNVIGHSHICYVPHAIRKRWGQVFTIRLTGRGTSKGVFYTDIELAE